MTSPAVSNVVDLSVVRMRRGMEPANLRRVVRDRRRHLRTESRDRLFAQIVGSPDDQDLVGVTIAGVADNVSVGGLQFSTDCDIPTGTLVDLWVDVHSRPGKFFLTGEVRWSHETADGAWYVGVQLSPGTATDIEEWQRYHHRLQVR
jgi:hypothetical protein